MKTCLLLVIAIMSFSSFAAPKIPDCFQSKFRPGHFIVVTEDIKPVASHLQANGFKVTSTVGRLGFIFVQFKGAKSKRQAALQTLHDLVSQKLVNYVECEVDRETKGR